MSAKPKSLTTDRQSVMYWATTHLLARLYFDSNTQETTKKSSVEENANASFRHFKFFAITRKEIPSRSLTVVEAFTYIS